MVEQLFGSKTRVKLLQLFYSNPDRSFYVREITRKIDEQINSVRRELSNLLSIGIIQSDNADNNRLYYEVNQTYEYYQPLKAIFGGGVMTVEEAPSVKAEAHDIKSIGNVQLAFYTGQFTRDETSGIDMLIVGDVNQTKVAKFVEDLELRESKEVRYAVLTPDDFHYRQQVKDRFLAIVLSAKKQVLIDKDNMFTKAPKKAKSEEE